MKTNSRKTCREVRCDRKCKQQKGIGIPLYRISLAEVKHTNWRVAKSEY